MKKKNFVLKTDLDEKTKNLSDEEIGKVFRKIFKYVKGDILPTLSEKLEMVFDFIKIDIDENEKKYEDRCKKNKEAAEKRWKNQQFNTNVCECIPPNAKHADNDSDSDYDIKNKKEKNIKKEKSSKNFFSKPTLEEVQQYCLERKNKVDAQRFVDYYEANGWKVGRNSMKDWKACVRTWERNDGNFSSKREQVSTQDKKLPIWFGENIKLQETTKQEKEELEELIKTLED